MGSEGQTEALDNEAVEVVNAQGHGRIVIACDHASNFIPAEFENLGLPLEDLERHIAWDPGARPVALAMSKLLDAPLVCSRISRLVIDCNRPLSAPDLVPPVSETTEVPGNRDLGADDVARRAQLAHAPFHAAIDRLLIARERAGMETWLISVHSFTPVYKGVDRPWHIGIIHDADDRLAGPMVAALKGVIGLEVGVNQPYSPADRVYYTLERHGRARGLACAMIEIRNDEIGDEAGQRKWAELLSAILAGLRPAGCP